MAQTLSLPFYTIKIQLNAGIDLTIPLMDNGAVRINEPSIELAKKYATQFQQKVLNKGDLVRVMDELKEGDFIKKEVSVSFPAAKDKISYPAFDLRFEYFFNENEHGFWGIIPTLGIEGFAKEEPDLMLRLQEVVRLEFARKRRLTTVQQIVSAIWYESINLEQNEVSYQIPSLSELEKLDEEDRQQLLPEVGQKLEIKNHKTYGREQELEQLGRIIKSGFHRNILIAGPSGVGKTALIWELARKKTALGITNNIWETTASTLIKELTRETGWQDNLVFLAKELAEKGDWLFVRNLAELFEVGQYEGNEVSMAEYLRSFISRGDIGFISECTEEELARIELRSPNYISFFQVIRLETPTKQLEEIILKKMKDLSVQQKVKLEKEAVKEVIRLHQRFTPYSGMPGKPIRFLESLLMNQKSEALDLQKNISQKTSEINRANVIHHFCEETGMPTFLVDPAIPMDLKSIKSNFNNNVFGQEKAVENVVDMLGAVKTALTRTGKPIASFLFVGPTGVGKTELAKVLASFTFGSRERIVRFDMSEFSNPWSVLRLTGTGFRSDGLLTAAIRREPFCVLLFDEIEKADSTFFDLLLQILGEGRLTDSRGKLVNFCSTIIIMTSNIGAGKMQTKPIGWQKERAVSEVTALYMDAVEKHFRPELFNRIDQVIPFEPLSKDTMRFVVEREIGLLKKREGIQFRNMDLQIEDEVLDFLAVKGYNNKYGARHLQRTIQELLIIPLAKILNLEDFDDRLLLQILVENDKIEIKAEADPLGFDLLMEQWDKITYADQASDLRRKIYRLQEGHFFIKLLSKLDVFENEKQQEGEAFWKNLKRTEQYSYFLETKENVANLASKIEGLEMDISLACMDLKTYEVEIETALDDWKKAFFDLKIEIYTRLNPKSNTCYFAIYGSQLKPILDFYIEIFEQKEFEIKAKTVWFRESYYNEGIISVEISEDGEEKEVVKKKREEYLKEDWDYHQEEDFRPPGSGDLLYGVEFEIVGTCAHLYLKNEKGLQRWKSSDQEESIYSIRCGNKAAKTPENIHRQDFYKNQSLRRIFENGSFKDTKWKMAQEIPKTDTASFFIDILDKQFEKALDTEVGG